MSSLVSLSPCPNASLTSPILLREGVRPCFYVREVFATWQSSACLHQSRHCVQPGKVRTAAQSGIEGSSQGFKSV